MSNISNPIIIFECANTHGGNFSLLQTMVREHSQVVCENKHIKFQPLHPDKIATSKYEWYGVYKELFFSMEQWSTIIAQASASFNAVWVDLFDVYGVEVLKSNLDKIKGVKFQASVLDNQEILDALKNIDFSDKYIMLNVSGFELSEIQFFIEQFKQITRNAEVILQIGFQSYPTKLQDTGLQKINIVKIAFPKYKICIADHADAEDDMAAIIPLLAVTLGCELVEKHIVHDRATAKYDGFSSLQVPEMQLLVNRISKCSDVLKGPFISYAEKEYLSKSIQIPVLKNAVKPGMLLSQKDFIFRRTDQHGISYSKISEIQERKFIVSSEIEEGHTIQENDFDAAKVGAIVACRMKSSRLKSKAILPILGKTSVERCLESTLRIEGVDEVILATSTLDEDSVLKEYDLGGKVKFWQGDPDDVISRYLGACDAYGIDVIVRVTADCPVMSAEIAEKLLEHHFKSGADYTAANDCAVGTACEIYNTEALRRVISYVGSADYSEYMTWYMQNNRNIFKVEIVDLPKEMVRDYRLTLDHAEDLELFNQLYKKLDAANMQPSLSNIFKLLDDNPSIAAINSHIGLKYKTDQELIALLDKKTKINI